MPPTQQQQKKASPPAPYLPRLPLVRPGDRQEAGQAPPARLTVGQAGYLACLLSLPDEASRTLDALSRRSGVSQDSARQAITALRSRFCPAPGGQARGIVPVALARGWVVVVPQHLGERIARHARACAAALRADEAEWAEAWSAAEGAAGW